MFDKAGKESQYNISRPELGSDPPIGSDQKSGCDMIDSDIPICSPAEQYR